MQRYSQDAEYSAAPDITCHAESWQSLGRRFRQEDRFIISPVIDGQLCVIMDGHGGSIAADRVNSHLVEDFMSEFIKVRADSVDLKPFTKSQDRMLIRRTIAKLVERCRGLMSGSTLSLVYAKPIRVSGEKQPTIRIHAATLGDSPVAIWNASRLMLMPVHSAEYHKKDKDKINSLIYEGQQRIESMTASETDWIYRRARIEDGYVWRQRGGDHQLGLAMTRAIGDEGLDGLLIRRADIRTYDIPIGGMVLLTSDGALDDDSPKAVRKRTRDIIDKARMEELPLDMIGKGLGERKDNTTMIVMRWSDV